MIWAILTLFVVLTYFIWAYIHEYSHLSAIRHTIGISKYEIRIIPHKHEGRFYWARITYKCIAHPTEYDLARIAFAPRVPAFVAALMFPIAPLLPDTVFWFWSVFFAGGIVDTITGSIGWNENSDLQKVARAWHVSSWVLRVLYLSWVVASVGGWVWQVVA